MKNYLLPTAVLALGICSDVSGHPNWVRYVDPLIGTDGTGHVAPGAIVPFGMVFPGPDNPGRGWAYTSGYQFRNPRIAGFSNTHLSGTGDAELGDVLLQPSAGKKWSARTTDFSAGKAEESASPGYYRVRLKTHQVRVELTASSKVAVQRYRFARSGTVQVLVDLQHGLNDGEEPSVVAASVSERPDGLQGTLHRRNWVERQVSFVVSFDRPVLNRQVLPARPGEKAPRFILEFAVSTDRLLEARIALSTVDELGAQKNLATIQGQSFDEIKATAEAEWDELLGRIQIEASESQRTLFYSALYRALQFPSEIADADGRVRGPRGDVLTAPHGVYYSTMSLWDTFRASHPLFTLIVPERVPGFVNSMLAHEQQMGYLPLWPCWGRETYAMIGNPALVVIADALRKGFAADGAIDVEAALAAMVRTSTQPRPDSPAEQISDWQMVERFGYLPFDLRKDQSVSVTAELSLGDAAVASVADLLGRTDLAARFRSRSKAWLNLYDESTGTLRGRDSRGRWRPPYDPVLATAWYQNPGDYTEASAWQYTATPALQETQAFVERLGGPRALESWLDQFFGTPGPPVDKELGQEGLIGQYAQANEPSHHITWLYAYTGKPEKGQRLRERIVQRFYSAKPTGLLGNDDAGQMSAWLVFAMLGFYPVEPFSGQYVLGRPMLKKAVLKVGAQPPLTIVGHGSRVRLNGAVLAGPTVSHAGLTHGGVLAFE
jgi:predicted alpha-1,2-mannosidase